MEEPFNQRLAERLQAANLTHDGEAAIQLVATIRSEMECEIMNRLTIKFCQQHKLSLTSVIDERNMILDFA